MVLLPKPDGSSQGIGLLEVLWKLLTSIIDGRLKAAISFHDALHGFRPHWGTTTAIIEAKFFQQLALIQQVPVFEIFIDLKKVYDTLDRERTLEILERYSMGALTLQLLRQFWDRQLVVAKQGRHFGVAFPATRGVTQGDIVSPTIFNIVVDAIVRHWLIFVLDDGSGVNGFGRTVREELMLFYANDGLLAAHNHLWLQMALSRLCELFERVGLRTNVQKTKTMTCTPGYISGQVVVPAYRRRMEGVGESYRERQCQCVECSICGKDLAASSLDSHYRTTHGTVPQGDVGRADAPGRQPAEYRVSFAKILTRVACPVAGCSGNASSWTNLRRHFMYGHPCDVIVILEEGHLPRCKLCGMHVPLAVLAGGHRNSAFCREGVARN
jgi:hypothetical protein